MYVQQLNERKKNTTSVLLQGSLLYGQNTKPYIIVSYSTTHTVLNNSASNAYNNNYCRRSVQSAPRVYTTYSTDYTSLNRQKILYTADLIYDRFISCFFPSIQLLPLFMVQRASRAVLVQIATTDLRPPTVVRVRAHIFG